jgi:hypothetical protein
VPGDIKGASEIQGDFLARQQQGYSVPPAADGIDGLGDGNDPGDRWLPIGIDAGGGRGHVDIAWSGRQVSIDRLAQVSLAGLGVGDELQFVEQGHVIAPRVRVVDQVRW